MARLKGSKNKNSSALPEYSLLTSEQRIEVLANLIVDRILEDQNSGEKLLSKIVGKDYVRVSST
jgi:hypothetical protein